MTVGFCLVLVLLVAMGAHAATAAPPPAAEKTINEANHGQRVEVNGELLVVNLEGNPSTGYGWQVQGLDGAVLRQVGQPEWVSAPGQAKPGAPATQVLRFAGVARGATTLNLAYVRPWEKDARPAKTYSVQVRVSQPSQNVPEVAAPGQKTTAAATASLAALPPYFNWCDQGGCTPIRDQGQCGSCWAFSTVGPLESAILLKDGVSRDLAEQYLVSCNTDGWGCGGGWWAHDYHEWKYSAPETAAGAVYESDFPYTATDAPCMGPYGTHEKIVDWVYVGPSDAVPSTDAIKQAIVDHGPVSAVVCVNTAFQTYPGGVFNPTQPCRQTNHAIVLVGWDDSKGAWRLRNSWGTGWGEDGYMWIVYGKSIVGWGANYVVYNEAPPPTAKMHVSAIDMSYVKSGKSYVIYTEVSVVDATGLPVPSATVALKTTLPSGATTSSSRATGTDGTVTFSVKSKLTGTYISEVTGITHATYLYDAAANLETHETLAVP
jgi:inhibitor of cysteine peptidase